MKNSNEGIIKRQTLLCTIKSFKRSFAPLYSRPVATGRNWDFLHPPKNGYCFFCNPPKNVYSHRSIVQLSRVCGGSGPSWTERPVHVGAVARIDRHHCNPCEILPVEF